MVNTGGKGWLYLWYALGLQSQELRNWVDHKREKDQNLIGNWLRISLYGETEKDSSPFHIFDVKDQPAGPLFNRKGILWNVWLWSISVLDTFLKCGGIYFSNIFFYMKNFKLVYFLIFLIILMC
jgi:hypothetical protein